MRAKDVLGRAGEDLAAQFLGNVGLTVLERNWRCAGGEIDIVALDGDVLVVCEVKTRSSDRYGGPLQAVSEQKLARLRRLAARWMNERAPRVLDAPPRGIRIDLLAVWAGPAPTLEHLRGIG